MTEHFTDFDSFGLDDFSSFDEPAHGAGAVSDVDDFSADIGLPNGAALAVVDSDQAVREYLAQQLGQGVATVSSLLELESRFGLSPIVVILGPSCIDPTDLAIVERWSRTNPEVGAILVTSELSTTLLHTALRAGVKDVLTAPIDQMQLVDTVARVAESLSGMSGGRAMMASGSSAPVDLVEGDPGEVITVFSTKGGSGKSVIATNIAVALARVSERPVVLIDAHLQFGDCAVMLKIQPQHTVVDAISQIDKLDPGLLRDLMSVHAPSGLLVMAAPTEPTFADQINGEQMVRLIEMVRTIAGHVIVDLPAYFNDVVLSLIEASDHIVLVAGLDIPNIKNVKIGLTTLKQLSIPLEKIQLVLNRADSKVKLDVGEVEKTLHINAAAHVPSDVVVPISVNKGVPVVLSAPRSEVAKALEQLALGFLNGAAVRPKDTQAGRRLFKRGG